jgi:hypothetical protein
MAVFNESLRVTGDLRFSGSLAGVVPRSNIETETKVFEIPLTSLRVWDAVQTALPAVGSNDDIGFATGTFATNIPHLKSQDLNALGVMTREKARGRFTLPLEYVSAGAITFRLCAGMLTSVAATSATVDVQAYKATRTGIAVSGGDLVATSAISCNSTTLADKDFMVTATGLAAGDVLDFIITFDATSATASSHFLICTHLEVELDVKQ